MKHIHFAVVHHVCVQLVVTLLPPKVRTITLPIRRVGPPWAPAVAFAPACIHRHGTVAKR